MTSPLLDPRLIEKYLVALGVQQLPPSLEALRELVFAHLTRIPFENVSKLYYQRHRGLTGLSPLELFLEGVERYHFGGTCYANNFHFYCLLTSLGFDAKLCGADMGNPDVHLVTLVTVDRHEYLVDAGYAAPFLVPLPRDLPSSYVLELGRDRYVLNPQDAVGRSRLEHYREGRRIHGYLVKPMPRHIEEFSQVIQDSFRPTATFLNALLLVRFYSNRSVMVHNMTLVESAGNESQVRVLGSRDELVSTVEREFGIPGPIVSEAVSQLSQLRDAWD